MSLHSRPRKFIVSTIDDAGKNKILSFFNGKNTRLLILSPILRINFEKLKGKYGRF